MFHLPRVNGISGGSEGLIGLKDQGDLAHGDFHECNLGAKRKFFSGWQRREEDRISERGRGQAWLLAHPKLLHSTTGFPPRPNCHPCCCSLTDGKGEGYRVHVISRDDRRVHRTYVYLLLYVSSDLIRAIISPHFISEFVWSRALGIIDATVRVRPLYYSLQQARGLRGLTSAPAAHLSRARRMNNVRIAIN